VDEVDREKILFFLNLLFQNLVNPRANPFEMVLYLNVLKSNHSNSVISQEFRSFCITFQTFLGIVLPSVQFDDQFCLGTVEIGNISSQYSLP